MSNIYIVESVEEAIDLAKKFKNEERYDLFRGQSHNWKVCSSLRRLKQEEYFENSERIERLYQYFLSHNSLRKFTRRINEFFAIAQHYGLPTNYIDFSSNPEVAGYFATNSKQNIIGAESVIICLNSREFSDFIASTKLLFLRYDEILPYITKVKIRNLWRLQAQEGCFLYCTYPNIEDYYDFDRIIFTFNSSYGGILDEKIYPKQKSELEILLDRYFEYELRLERARGFEKFCSDNNVKRTSLPPIDNKKYLVSKVPKNYRSIRKYQKWQYSLKVDWKSIKNETAISIKYQPRDCITYQIEEIQKELTYQFKNKSVTRDYTLKFRIISQKKISRKLTKIVSENCLRIWEGTRCLPFSDEEIIQIISIYFCLEIFERKLNRTPALSNEKLVVLELGNKYGNSTRCYASPKNIVSAFRKDIRQIVAYQKAEKLDTSILLHINKPEYIFDFDELIKLFIKELIPYQVLYNSENKTPVIFYSPIEVTVIGYA